MPLDKFRAGSRDTRRDPSASLRAGRRRTLQSFFRSLLRCETVLILGGVDGDEEKSSPPGQNYFWSESGAAPGAWPWA
jgi:hypothetical protein